MKIITETKIRAAVAELCSRANIVLRSDVLAALRKALVSESDVMAKKVLHAIIANAQDARRKKLAICQDTGMPFVLVEIGNGVRIRGDVRAAINKGIEEGYRKSCLRNSIVKDPLSRGVSSYYPGIIHLDMVRGNSMKISVLPKGFGCENKTQLRMFNPTSGIEEIKKFIVDAVKSAGPDACPPYIVGVGIGGTADYAMFLSKKALLKKIYSSESGRAHNVSQIKKLETDVCDLLNTLNIGPMGLGGKTTCLGVNIITYPTHIAGLPVAVNISCHALRSATAVL